MSVVMPVYNAEAFLAEAIDSVLGQALEDLELVAVDDGSRDGSRAILERAALTDPRVRVVVNERNLGMAATLNRGWREARAPLVARLDADDVALADRLTRQAEFLDAHPTVAAVGGAAITIDETGRRIAVKRYPATSRAIRSMLLWHNCLAHSSVTMRRAALEAVGGYRLRAAEDYDLWLRLSERFDLANLREPVILQRFHLQQQSLRIIEQDAREARAVCAAARVRRASGVDPLAGVHELTPQILQRLDIDEAELTGAVQRELLLRAATLVDLGHTQEAAQLVERASPLLGGRAERAFAATVELNRAEGLLRGRRPLAGVRHVGRAFRAEPQHALSMLGWWLGARLPLTRSRPRRSGARGRSARATAGPRGRRRP